MRLPDLREEIAPCRHRVMPAWFDIPTWFKRCDSRELRTIFPSADVFEYEQAECRGEIGPLACSVDLRDQLRHRRLLAISDFFQVAPEGIFEGDAGLLSMNDNGTFQNRGFHLCIPKKISLRLWSY